MMVAAACTDRAAPFAPTTESESVLMASRTAAANESKVAVCHRDGKDNYRVISVSENALAAHVRHGDVPPVEGSCSAEVGPFSFVSVDKVFDVEENLYQIVWSVAGTPSAVTFEVQQFIESSGGPGGPPSGWVHREYVSGGGPGSYESLEFYGTGTYRILATLSDETQEPSLSVIIP